MYQQLKTTIEQMILIYCNIKKNKNNLKHVNRIVLKLL